MPLENFNNHFIERKISMHQPLKRIQYPDDYTLEGSSAFVSKFNLLKNNHYALLYSPSYTSLVDFLIDKELLV